MGLGLIVIIVFVILELIKAIVEDFKDQAVKMNKQQKAAKQLQEAALQFNESLSTAENEGLDVRIKLGFLEGSFPDEIPLDSNRGKRLSVRVFAEVDPSPLQALS